MKKTTLKTLYAFALFLGMACGLYAQTTFTSNGNPIITNLFSADPSPKVFSDGKLWLYASHDQNNATSYEKMDGYHVYSTSDLKTWTDHGEVLHSRDVSWGIAGGGWMWAPDGVEKNGKYYMYFPHKEKATPNNYWRIGVAIADRPEGPYKPEPNFIKGTGGTDPMCFIDDDGTAYLLFGSHRIAKLKSNMTELAEDARTINYGASNFKEGAFMHKRNGKYYYSWTDYSGNPDQGFYAIGDSPYGPFTYKGAVGPRPSGAQDHHGIVKFKQQWYYFYHKGSGGDYGNVRRRVCIDYLCYNSDGTMKKVTHTTAGVGKAGVDRLCQDGGGSGGGGTTTCSTVRKEAESFSAQSGTQKEGSTLAYINNGDYADYSVNVPCAGSYTFRARVASGGSGGTITFKKGSTNLGSVSTQGTGGWTTWQNKTVTVNNLSAGTQTFRLAFSGTGTGFLFNVDWFELQKNSSSKIGSSDLDTSTKTGSLDETDENLKTVTVYPTPAKDYVVVDGLKTQSPIQLYSLQGQLISEIRNTNRVDLSNLPAGMYLIKTEGKSYKVIKK